MMCVSLINLLALVHNDVASGTSRIRENDIAAGTCWEKGKGSQGVSFPLHMSTKNFYLEWFVINYILFILTCHFVIWVCFILFEKCNKKVMLDFLVSQKFMKKYSFSLKYAPECFLIQ